MARRTPIHRDQEQAHIESRVLPRYQQLFSIGRPGIGMKTRILFEHTTRSFCLDIHNPDSKKSRMLLITAITERSSIRRPGAKVMNDSGFLGKSFWLGLFVRKQIELIVLIATRVHRGYQMFA